MQITLPYPPSINHLHGMRLGRRKYLSRAGREFYAAVRDVVVAHGTSFGSSRLTVVIDVYPPDKRKRDLDNIIKPLLDAMQHGGAYFDDSQIDDLHIRRCGCLPGGCVKVSIKSGDGDAEVLSACSS